MNINVGYYVLIGIGHLLDSLPNPHEVVPSGSLSVTSDSASVVIGPNVNADGSPNADGTPNDNQHFRAYVVDTSSAAILTAIYTNPDGTQTAPVTTAINPTDDAATLELSVGAAQLGSPPAP